MLRVFETPVFVGGENDEPTSWKLGPFANSVLSAINVAYSAGNIVTETDDLTDCSQDDIRVPESKVEGKTNPLKWDAEGFGKLFGPRRKVTCGTDDE